MTRPMPVPGRLRLPGALAGIRGLAPAGLPTEVLAGVTLAALMIPLNIGYAGVAGLPPEAGLYAAIVPSIAFALLAHTRHLVASPDAAIAAMFAGMLGVIVPTSDPYYAQLVLATTLLCGLIFAAFWAFRLGFLANFLSYAVLVGFITGLGIEVLVSQVEKILAVSVEAEGFFRELWALVLALPEAHLPSVAIGVGTIVAIRALGRVAPRLPAALIALAGATIVVAVLDLDARGVKVLGPVTGGLPGLTIPQVRLEDWGALVPIAFALCVATLAEAPLIARRYAERYGEPSDADQDLFAFGGANAAAALTGGLAIGSSASRTAAVDAAGSRSQVPSLVAGIVVALVLLFFTGLLAMLPSAALAGIVASAVVGLIEVEAFRELWRVRRSEFVVAAGATVAVLVMGVLQGVLIAFSLSMLDLLWRASKPASAVLVEVPGVDAFEASPGAPARETRPGLLIWRFGAPIYFANALRFADEFATAVDRAPSPVRWAVLDASSIRDLDTSGARALRRVADRFGAAGITLAVSRAEAEVVERLERHGLLAAIGQDRVFATNREAMTAFDAELTAPGA